MAHKAKRRPSWKKYNKRHPTPMESLKAAKRGLKKVGIKVDQRIDGHHD